jgi:3-methyladenine DNA glycosylase AlkD
MTAAPANLEDTLMALERLGDPKLRQQNIKRGAPDNQFGVKMGDVRALAKAIKSNHDLGLQLWATGNLDAMLLATLILKPKQLSEEDLERMAAAVTYGWLADWLMSNVIRQHPGKETLRQHWMQSDHPWLARAGWSLTAERVEKQPENLDLPALLDRIEREMAGAPEPAQWTMNGCLAQLGIRFPEHRERAIAIGEKLGVYRDFPCSKGCVSPFAPIWIGEMVARRAA